ncbi:hypothetical protein ACKI2N_015520 [Cupriavidus sp. 30B13]|uniref:hypothetical protein n=1 Tax=Cupriavidus sp. 30B13 TaxID=3384241 RepID=UPI003B907AAC
MSSTVGSSGCNAFHSSLLIFFHAMLSANVHPAPFDDMVLLMTLSSITARRKKPIAS